MTGRAHRASEPFRAGRLDADIDMLVEGVVGDPRLLPLVPLVDDVHDAAGGAPPAPRGELVDVLAGRPAATEVELSPGAALATRIGRLTAPPPDRRPAPGRRARRRPRRAGTTGLVAKVAMGLLVAGAGAAGAGAAGVLPDRAGDAVRRAIEVTTPFELPGPAVDDPRDEHGGGRGARQAPAGRASSDAVAGAVPTAGAPAEADAGSSHRDGPGALPTAPGPSELTEGTTAPATGSVSAGGLAGVDGTPPAADGGAVPGEPGRPSLPPATAGQAPPWAAPGEGGPLPSEDTPGAEPVAGPPSTPGPGPGAGLSPDASGTTGGPSGAGPSGTAAVAGPLGDGGPVPPGP